jgi:hypothetical protein
MEKLFKQTKGLPKESGTYYAEYIVDATQQIVLRKLEFKSDDKDSVEFWNEFVFFYFQPLPESPEAEEILLSESIY